eukprot:GHVU01093002.1.p2 GENE.GHVU01093002.1~~GHVU01093002.1.p2  ORF type:complete len:110 (-),score=3.11 GHVU01093002.1:172-501(-)
MRESLLLLIRLMARITQLVIRPLARPMRDNSQKQIRQAHRGHTHSHPHHIALRATLPTILAEGLAAQAVGELVEGEEIMGEEVLRARQDPRPQVRVRDLVLERVGVLIR